MWKKIPDQATRLRAEEQPFVIATVVAYKSPQSARPGSKAIILPDGSIDGWKYKSHLEAATFYFCCVRCKESFDRSPESYLTQTAGGL